MKELVAKERGFQKGHNPESDKDNKKAARMAFLTLADDRMLHAVPKIIQVVIEKALQGDLGAAKIILERLLPPAKHVDNTTRAAFGGIQIVVQGGGQAPVTTVIEKNTFDNDNIEEN